jgi:hypothetical protein
LGTVSRKSLCWSFEKKNIGSFRLTMALQKDKGFSISDPQQVLPLAKVTLESRFSTNLFSGRFQGSVGTRSCQAGRLETDIALP